MKGDRWRWWEGVCVNQQKIVYPHILIFTLFAIKKIIYVFLTVPFSLSEHFSYVLSVYIIWKCWKFPNFLFFHSLFVSIRFVYRNMLFLSFFTHFFWRKSFFYSISFSGSTIIQHFENSYLNISFWKGWIQDRKRDEIFFFVIMNWIKAPGIYSGWEINDPLLLYLYMNEWERGRVNYEKNVVIN